MPTKGPIPDSWLPYMRIIEFIGVLVAIGVVLFDFLSVRPIDRAVRVATLFAQIAQVHALPGGAGLQALTPSVEALAKEKVSMAGINLSGANLVVADLSGAILPGADLSGAYLSGTNLSGTNLSVSLAFVRLAPKRTAP